MAADRRPRALGLPWPGGGGGTGLVLGGGGARGAYQVGVLRRLGELGLSLQAVSGASVGALNAAVVATSPDLATAAERLHGLWRSVAGTGIPVAGPAPGALIRVLRAFPIGCRAPVFRPGALEALLAEHVDVEALRVGPDLWVSVAHVDPRTVTGRRLVDQALVTLQGWLVGAGRFVRVQDLPPDQARAAVLASASLPFVLPGAAVGKVWCQDGGMFDNLPIRPLLGPAGCRRLVAVHLEDQPLGLAQAHTGIDLTEISPSRPRRSADALGWAEGLLDFSSASLDALERLGYDDALRTVGSPERPG